MPIINDLKEIWVHSDDPDEGTEDALRAVEAAVKLSIPCNCNIALFAHIHSTWEPTCGWLTGYTQTITDNGYVPGFIFGINNPIFYSESDFIKTVKNNDVILSPAQILTQSKASRHFGLIMKKSQVRKIFYCCVQAQPNSETLKHIIYMQKIHRYLTICGNHT